MDQMAPAGLPKNVYYGVANTWECDEMGHLNVRYYVRKAGEAFVSLMAEVGLGPRMCRDNGLTLKITDQHVRFLRELLPGKAIVGRGGFIELSDTGGVAAIELLRSADDVSSATFLMRFELLKDGDACAWPADTAERASQAMGALAAHIGPRSVLFDPAGPDPSIEDAERFEMQTIRKGVVDHELFDAGGELAVEHYIGLISDGIPNFIGRDRELENAKSGGPRVGGAALEYRLTYRRSPRPGDVVRVLSAPRAVSDKTFHFCHWIFEAETDQILATAENVAVSFDLDARKIIPVPEARRASIMKTLQSDLWV